MVAGVGTQFSYELAFGVLFSLAFVPKAPVGALFYRVMGSAAVVLLAVGLWLHLSRGGRWSDPASLGAIAAAAAFPFYSGPLRGWAWVLAVGVGIAGCAVATVACLATRLAEFGGLGLSLGSLSALATGAVAGSVGLAMVLGHWYLTVPNLDIGHLGRLNRVTVGAMLASLALLLLSCAIFADELNDKTTPLFGPWGLFSLGTRVAVGLLLPLLFAWMAASSLRFQNTRSATGILYASTVLVLIGTAVSVSLQDSYGLPL